MVQLNLQKQYEDIHARALEAVAHWDAVSAWSIYRELEKFVEGLPAGQGQELNKGVATLKRDLLVAGFPALPREEAGKLFREHILDFFQVDVDFKERLLTRYTFVGYGEKDEERKHLRETLSQNQERLGKFTLSEWMKLFDQRFKPETRDKQSAAAFLTQTSEVASLGKTEQSILRQILSVYDQYIVHEVLDEFDIAILSKNPDQTASLSSGGPGQKETVYLPLLQALPKYKNLGNQLITRERIKVKSQAEPVRPSLFYWLKYYRDELGIGQHSSVERGDFLFRSENGKKLSGEERERISLILKSVEENLPLSIDPKNQEIIFPASNAFSITSAGKPAFHDVAISASPTQRGEPGASPSSESGGLARNDSLMSPRSDSGGLHISRGTSFNIAAPASAMLQRGTPASAMLQRGDPAQTKSARPNVPFGTGEVSFSTGHVFPVEKEAVESRDAPLKNETTLAFQPVSPVAEQGKPVSTPVPAPQPASATFQPASSSASDRSSRDGSLGARGEPNPVSSRSRTLLQKLNSFRIRPVSLGRKDWERGADENHES